MTDPEQDAGLRPGGPEYTADDMRDAGKEIKTLDLRETTTSSPSPNPTEYRFYVAGKEIGRLWWDDGELHFEGKADKSARLFLESLSRLTRPSWQ